MEGGKLIGNAGEPYHKAWAMYFKKFLDEYKSRGIDIWAITTQNEPTAKVRWQSMSWVRLWLLFAIFVRY